MKAWLALAALAATSPALVTSAAPLGKFGDWALWSSPPELPPIGQTMPPVHYSATFGDNWTTPWGAESRISFGPEGAVVTTFGGECSLREQIAASGGRSQDSAALMEVLLRQARHVETCVLKAGAPPVYQPRMRASMPDFRRMLKRLSEVARWDGRANRAASQARPPRNAPPHRNLNPSRRRGRPMMDMPMPPPGHEQTIAAVAACGVSATSVRIAYVDELQSDVVTISASGGTDEARLRCVKQVVHPIYFVHFDDEAADAAYQGLVMAEATRWARVEARRRLGARGLLKGMPRYQAGKVRLAKFVRDVEAHCSVKRGSAIEILSPTAVTLRVKFMQSMLSSANPSQGDRLTCLMNVLTVSGLAEGGVDFVFVGNEAAATKDNEH